MVPCGNCVDRLAYKLMANHKIDMVRAYELAERGVERHEAKSVTREEVQTLGSDPDYSTVCSSSGVCHCLQGVECDLAIECRAMDTCACSCPAPPKAHSHYVSNTCSATMLGCTCINNLCGGANCRCTCAGNCYFSCDDGYVWNPATLQCELAAVAAPRLLMDGFIDVQS